LPIKKILKYNTAWFVWALFILYALLIKKSSIPHFDFYFIWPTDKWVHVFLFLVLMLFLCWGFYFQKKALFSGLRGVFLFFLLGATFGGVTELMQEFLTSDRTADVFDFTSDVAGLIIGAVVFEMYFKKNLIQKRKILHF